MSSPDPHFSAELKQGNPLPYLGSYTTNKCLFSVYLVPHFLTSVPFIGDPAVYFLF